MMPMILMAALAGALLLGGVPALALAEEAPPEQPLEAQIEDEQAEPVEVVEDEALPEEASPEAVVEEETEPLEAVADEAGPLDANSGGTVSVYRLFNRRTSEHLYTTSRSEYEGLPRKTHGDWMWEGAAWVAPKKSSTPVYRLYNGGLGDHHYTTSKGERDALTRKGWRYEGIAFYSDDSKRVPLYRVYNGRLKAGQHHYTTSKGERDPLVKKSGWRNEGVGFYAVRRGSNSGVEVDRSVQCTIPAGTYRGTTTVSYDSENNVQYRKMKEVTLIVGRDGRFEIRDPNSYAGENLTRYSGYISGHSVEYKQKGWDYTDTLSFSFTGGSKPYIDMMSTYVIFWEYRLYRV